MRVSLVEKAQKQYRKLPTKIQLKVDKAFRLLIHDYRHPSLRTKKKSDNTLEGRVDYRYRFSFTVEGESIFILTVGMHDTGLGKK